MERIYSFLLGGLTSCLLVATWRKTSAKGDDDWLPVVFWLLPSVVTWSIVNNMLETTQTALTMLAVLAVVCALTEDGVVMIWGPMAGLAVLAAVLAKGPTGLFPLAAPWIAAAFMPDRSGRAVRSGAIMAGTLALASALVLSSASARQALGAYWQQHVLAAMSRARGTGRWASLVGHLGSGVLVRMTALFAVVWLCSMLQREKCQWLSRRPSEWTWFFLFLGVAASVPVAASQSIAGHYFVPSIPIFALGFAGLSVSLCGPTITTWQEQMWVRRTSAWGGILLLVASLVVPTAWGPIEPRDVDRIRSYQQLSPHIPTSATLGTCDAANQEWALHAYLQRLFKVSLDAEHGGHQPYYLKLNDRPCEAPPTCRQLAPTKHFTLLDCSFRE